MRWLLRQWLPLGVLVVAVTALMASVAVVANGPTVWGPASMMTWGTGGGGPVETLAEAEAVANRFARGRGLGVEEVMRFESGFYAVLVDSGGKGATEVLVEPSNGFVQLEWGPAMMWNTAYGMHPAWGTGGLTVSPLQARRSANSWLQVHRPGERAEEAEAFPGYYTLHTMRAGRLAGMLSVNATTGRTWYHTWHGRFIGMRESEGQ